MSILVIKPSDEFKAELEKSLAKFNNIYSSNESFREASNIVDAVRDLSESTNIRLMIFELKLDSAGANSFLGTFQRSKKKPIVITTAENFSLLQKEIPRSHLIVGPDTLDASYLFSCFRNLLDSGPWSIDIRIVKNILVSVVDVIHENTGIMLKPEKLEPLTNPSSSQDVMSSLSFWGDGLLGSLRVCLGDELARKMTCSMLGCTAEDVNDEMVSDLFGELNNQILGVVRNNLAEYDYDLKSGLQTVGYGESKFEGMQGGQQFVLPYEVEGQSFKVYLRCASYKLEPQALSTNQETKSADNVVDVRVVNVNRQELRNTIGDELGARVEGLGIEKLASDLISSSSLYYTVLRGSTGNLVLAWDLSNELEQKLEDPKKLFDAYVEQVWQDAKKNGYDFQMNDYGILKGSEQKVLIRDAGRFFWSSYQINKMPFRVLIGMNTKMPSGYYNVWSYLQEAMEAA